MTFPLAVGLCFAAPIALLFLFALVVVVADEVRFRATGKF